MAIIEHEVRLSSSDLTRGRRHLFSRDAYYAMGELGVFHDKRVELIDGEIIEKPPVSLPHAAICDPIAFLLRDIVGVDYTVRTQAPITLGDESNPSEPEPDIVVVVGPWRDYLKRRPNKNDVQLIVEIADSTLAYDRTIKARLYSDAQIPEYWIVNLVDVLIEVHRQPTDAGYSELAIYRVGESMEPLLAFGKIVAVSEILP